MMANLGGVAIVTNSGVVVDQSSPGRLRVGEVERPETRAGDILVPVDAVSLNRDEVERRSRRRADFGRVGILPAP
jgi:NADPH:quinone reductase-like Zn-dependent oxidoreductase